MKVFNDFQSHQVIVELNWDIPSENIVQVVRSSQLSEKQKSLGFGDFVISLDSLSEVSVKKCSSNCDWSINFNTSHGFESWVDHEFYEHQSDLKSNCSERSIMLRCFFPPSDMILEDWASLSLIQDRWCLLKVRNSLLTENVGGCLSPFMAAWFLLSPFLKRNCSSEWPTSLRICGWTRLQLVARNSSVSSPLRERRGVCGSPEMFHGERRGHTLFFRDRQVTRTLLEWKHSPSKKRFDQQWH